MPRQKAFVKQKQTERCSTYCPKCQCHKHPNSLLVAQEENFIGSVKKKFAGIKQGVKSKIRSAKKDFDLTYKAANKQIALATHPGHKSSPPSSPGSTTSKKNIRESKSDPKSNTGLSQSTLDSATDSDSADWDSAADLASESKPGAGSQPVERGVTPDPVAKSASGSESESESEESEQKSEEKSEQKSTEKPGTEASAKEEENSTAKSEPVRESEYTPNMLNTVADAVSANNTKPVNGVMNSDTAGSYADNAPETNKNDKGSPDTKNMQNHSMETQELAHLLHAYKQKRESDAAPVLTIDIPLQQCIDK